MMTESAQIDQSMRFFCYMRCENEEIGGGTMLDVDVTAGSDGTIIVRVTRSGKTHHGWRYCKYILNPALTKGDKDLVMNDNNQTMPIKQIN